VDVKPERWWKKTDREMVSFGYGVNGKVQMPGKHLGKKSSLEKQSIISRMPKFHPK